MFRRPLGPSVTRRAVSAAFSSRRSASSRHPARDSEATFIRGPHAAGAPQNSGVPSRDTKDVADVCSSVMASVMAMAPSPSGPAPLHRSRALLAPARRPQGPSSSSSSPKKPHDPTPASTVHVESAEQEGHPHSAHDASATPTMPAPPSAYDITVESVLLPKATYTEASLTLKGLVGLLLDPDTSAVEAVSLADFVAMVPKRQLKALGGNQEWLDVIVGSEPYQATRDARALRLAGVVSLGRWDEVPDRVPISPYSRGLLTQAYQDAMRTRGQSQKEEVLSWLTQAIQRAVAHEFAAVAAGQPGRRGYAGETLLPLVEAAEPKGLPASSTPPPTTAAVKERTKAAELPVDIDETNDDADGAVVRAEEEEEGALAEDEDTDDAEVARMMAELEAAEVDMEKELAPPEDAAPSPPSSSPPRVRRETVQEVRAKPGSKKTAPADAAAAGAAAWFNRGPGVKKARAASIPPAEVEVEDEAAVVAQEAERQQQQQLAAEAAAELDEVEEVVEEVEEVVEEVVEEEEEEVAEEEAAAADDAETGDADASPSSDGDAAADAAPAASGSTSSSSVDPKLSRLAQLMLTQFNSADGFLHTANKKELKADERAGFVTVMDEGTAAQVDPLALFSAFHNAKIAADAPVEVRALKQVWNSFNAHQMLMEDAHSARDEAFHRQKSVDALVQGALMMRAISREEEVVLDHASLLPSYGFPLMSSDTRPYASPKPKDAPHTDISFMTVEVAVKAYKNFFANKDACNTPFRPRVDVNAGCGVVMLSGTTLHLYETSLKSSIQEDQVRANFAEAMLGILHVCRSGVLPRVNTVHYHIMITSLPSNGSGEEDEDGMRNITNEITAPTTIVSIDMTGPFTEAEKARLRALSEPLGFTADQMNEFNCIEDIVMEIDDATGVTVVHDLLQNRDDLEALLTPTLVELLPDDVGAAGEEDEGAVEEEAEEEEVEEQPSIKSRPLPPAATKKTPPASKGGKKAAAVVEEPDVFEEEEEEEGEVEYVEVDEEEDVEAPPPPPPANKKKASAAPVSSRKPMRTAAPQDADAAAVLAYELEAEEEEDGDTVVSMRPVPARGKRAGTTSARKVPEPVEEVEEEDDEDLYEVAEEGEEDVPPPPPPPARKAHGKQTSSTAQARRAAAPPPPPEPEYEEEYEEIEEEEEEEEEVPPPPPPAARRAPTPAAKKASASPASSPQSPPPQQQQQRRAPAAREPAVEEEVEEIYEEVEEDEDEEVEAPPPPPPPRHGAKKGRAPAASPSPTPASASHAASRTKPRAPPRAQEEGDAEEEGNEEDWYSASKNRPKRRYFS